MSYVWAALAVIIRKELRHIVRDAGTYRLLLLLEAFTLIVGGNLDTTARDLPVAIVDEDRTAASREFAQKIDATKTLKVAFVVDTPEAARALMRAGRSRVAVVIPAKYREHQVTGSGATVLAIVDGSDASAASQAMSALDGLGARMKFEAENENRHARKSVSLRSLILFNPQGRLAFFLIPGLIGWILIEFTDIAVGSLIHEREAPTMVRIMMSPLSPAVLVLGKLLPYLVLGSANLALLLLSMRWVFDVPVRGNALLLFIAGMLFIITVLALGAVCVGTSATERGAFQKSLFHYFLTVFLSGWLFPVASLPKYITPIAYLLPATHIIEIARGIAIRDASFADLLPNVVYLLIAPIVLLTIALPAFRKSLALP